MRKRKQVRIEIKIGRGESSYVHIQIGKLANNPTQILEKANQGRVSND